MWVAEPASQLHTPVKAAMLLKPSNVCLIQIACPIAHLRLYQLLREARRLAPEVLQLHRRLGHAQHGLVQGAD